MTLAPTAAEGMASRLLLGLPPARGAWYAGALGLYDFFIDTPTFLLTKWRRLANIIIVSTELAITAERQE